MTFPSHMGKISQSCSRKTTNQRVTTAAEGPAHDSTGAFHHLVTNEHLPSKQRRHVQAAQPSGRKLIIMKTWVTVFFCHVLLNQESRSCDSNHFVVSPALLTQLSFTLETSNIIIPKQTSRFRLGVSENLVEKCSTWFSHIFPIKLGMVWRNNPVSDHSNTFP